MRRNSCWMVCKAIKTLSIFVVGKNALNYATLHSFILDCRNHNSQLQQVKSIYFTIHIFNREASRIVILYRYGNTLEFLFRNYAFLSSCYSKYNGSQLEEQDSRPFWPHPPPRSFRSAVRSQRACLQP